MHVDHIHFLDKYLTDPPPIQFCILFYEFLILFVSFHVENLKNTVHILEHCLFVSKTIIHDLRVIDSHEH